MYLLTVGSGVNYAYPDSCYTVVGTATTAVTYPSTSYSSMASPYTTSVYIECAGVVTLTSYDTISTGDEAGTLGGVTSLTFDGETMYTSGCTNLYTECSPAQRYSSVTAQNCLGVLSNAVGSCITPSQYIAYGAG